MLLYIEQINILFKEYYERKELKMENHYEILGLNMNATQEEIKAAYHDIVKKIILI